MHYDTSHRHRSYMYEVYIIINIFNDALNIHSDTGHKNTVCIYKLNVRHILLSRFQYAVHGALRTGHRHEIT